MRSRRIVKIVLAGVLGFAATPSVSWGWGDGGHMAVALRAWDDMTPEARASAIALLKQNPRFALDFAAKMPADLPTEQQDRWLFATAATWPDHVWALRITNPHDFNLYFHSSWHVIEEPVALDSAMQSTMPILQKSTATDPNKLSIADALPRAIKQLNDKTLPAADRSVALCWAMHMVGDLHEPCHAATLYSKRFPNGDRVATKFQVVVNGKTSGMHQFWDSLYCTSSEMKVLIQWEQDQFNNAALQRSNLPELTIDKTVDSWIEESYAIAKESVYDKDVRAGLAAQESDPQAKFQPIVLSDQYIAAARVIGQKRGVLAGLRLADTLNTVPW